MKTLYAPIYCIFVATCISLGLSTFLFITVAPNSFLYPEYLPAVWPMGSIPIYLAVICVGFYMLYARSKQETIRRGEMLPTGEFVIPQPDGNPHFVRATFSMSSLMWITVGGITLAAAAAASVMYQDMVWCMAHGFLFVVSMHFGSNQFLADIKWEADKVGLGHLLPSGHAIRTFEDGTRQLEVGVVRSDETLWFADTPERREALYARKMAEYRKLVAEPEPGLVVHLG